MLDKTILGSEFALSGSEQNPDLTGKDMKLLLERVKPGAVGPVEAFAEKSDEFLWADTPAELAAKMNALSGSDRIDADALERTIVARDRQVETGLGKDPQVVATAMARRYVVDKLIRVAKPHRLLDPAHGPLLAVRLSVLTRKTLGGLHTDLEGRVLRPDGEVLPGLWAVGEAVRVRRRRRARPPRAGGHVPGRLPVHGPDGGPRARARPERHRAHGAPDAPDLDLRIGSGA